MHDRCEAGYQRTGAYAPCIFVDEESGTVLYKSNFGSYHFLLVPLARITGIEDPVLLEAATPNYLYYSWRARFLVTSHLNNLLSESDVILTVNPKNARTQDQLHIHISCATPTLSSILKNIDPSEYVQWSQLPTNVEGHAYQALVVSGDALRSENLFKDVNTKVTADGKEMEYASVALAKVAPERFLLLLAEGTEDQPAPAETLQDPDCSIAKSG
ncbi:putative CDP-diacylglycerol pyrophosphatase [Mycobacterium lacus]|uniref:CDP-diacylglycerol diphosphatase n=1 Tax=Mycobacterium lacus TaxID=169765 RepID=A0A7I7NDP1_9MYCO|nr:putative CDP-diacylglycerol pyrophosphatase [Mycobacterium lacus]